MIEKHITCFFGEIDNNYDNNVAYGDVVLV